MAESVAAIRRRLLRRIGDNHRDGASRLAREALELLAEFADRHPAADAQALKRELLDFAEALAALRPSMCAIGNLVCRWRDGMAACNGDAGAVRAAAREEADAVNAWADAATEATVTAAVQRIGSARRILTHSSSSTVGRVLLALGATGARVIVTESRPGYEGRTLAATLARAGVGVTCITDAQAGLFVAEADAVLLGADAVLADGALVNKAGSLLIALAAREAGTPVVVAAEGFKRTAAEAIELEEMPGAELEAPRINGIEARNIYFDVTPRALIDCYCSDDASIDRLRP